MNRMTITRTLVGLLCALLLLASCAAGQKQVDGIVEPQITPTGSPASAQATEAPVEALESDETYYEEHTVEAEPEAEPEASSGEAEQEESDEEITVGKVAIGALKVVGLVAGITATVALYAGLILLAAL